MYKTFEVQALVTRKIEVLVKASDGAEAMELVEKDFFSDSPDFFDKNITRIDVRSAVEVVKDD